MDTGHENTIWMSWQTIPLKTMNDIARTWLSLSLSPYTCTLAYSDYQSNCIILLIRKISVWNEIIPKVFSLCLCMTIDSSIPDLKLLFFRTLRDWLFALQNKSFPSFIDFLESCNLCIWSLSLVHSLCTRVAFLYQYIFYLYLSKKKKNDYWLNFPRYTPVSTQMLCWYMECWHKTTYNMLLILWKGNIPYYEFHCGLELGLLWQITPLTF